MNPRVMLYAEGVGETGAGQGLPPPPLDEIWEDALGPGHWLIRRAIATSWQIPEAAIRFVSPLRHRAQIIRGSMLLDREILRRAATFADPRRMPDLVIMLVDSDGDADRKRELELHVADLPSPPLIVCPAPEFEAWLLADHDAVRALAGSVQAPASPESLAPRAAKELLADWTHQVEEGRLSLARTANLKAMANRCPSFASLLDELSRRRAT